MKFLCISCDAVMGFAERQLPGDGTMAAVFTCPSCDREIAMLTNPMETQLVASLGVKVGGRTLPEQPFELTRSSMASGGDVFADADDDADAERASSTTAVAGAAAQQVEGAGAGAAAQQLDAAGARAGPVAWSPDALKRLGRVPSFVRGMVKRIYTDYAKEHGIASITPEVMDRARTDLGLEGM